MYTAAASISDQTRYGISLTEVYVLYEVARERKITNECFSDNGRTSSTDTWASRKRKMTSRLGWGGLGMYEGG